TSITTNLANVHSGSDALRIGGSGSGGAGQVVTSRLTPNSSYQLKVWGKITAGGGDGFVGITFFNGTTQVNRKSTKISGSSYKQYTIAAIAPEQFTYCDVWFSKDDGTSVMYAD